MDHPETEEPRIADSRQKLTKDDHGPGLPPSLWSGLVGAAGRAPPTAKPWTGDRQRERNWPHKNKPANAPPFTHPRIPPPHARPNQKNIVQTSRSPLRCPSRPHTLTLSQSLTSLQLLPFCPFDHSTRYILGEIVSAPGAALGAPTAASPPLANALGDSRLFPPLALAGPKTTRSFERHNWHHRQCLCALLRRSPSRSVRTRQLGTPNNSTAPGQPIHCPTCRCWRLMSTPSWPSSWRRSSPETTGFGPRPRSTSRATGLQPGQRFC